MPFFVASRARKRKPRLFSLARWLPTGDVAILVQGTGYATRSEAEQSDAYRLCDPDRVAIVEAADQQEAARAAFLHFTGKPLPDPPPDHQR
jgi:hypothetical protein